MKYQMFYRQHLIAVVEEDNADFPTFFGHYQLETSINAPELAHLRAYIDYSVRVWPLIAQGLFNDLAMSEEDAFTDLIDSPDWSLVEIETQQRIPILIPVFCTNNNVDWRLNPATAG